MITGINHAGLIVQDLEKAIAFYRDVISLEVKTKMERTGEAPSKLLGYNEIHFKGAHMTPWRRPHPGADPVHQPPAIRSPHGGAQRPRRQPRGLHVRGHAGDFRSPNVAGRQGAEPSAGGRPRSVALLPTGPRGQLGGAGREPIGTPRVWRGDEGTQEAANSRPHSSGGRSRRRLLRLHSGPLVRETVCPRRAHSLSRSGVEALSTPSLSTARSSTPVGRRLASEVKALSARYSSRQANV